MTQEKLQKMDFNTDFVNESLDLYPLMGGTHYGSGANESFGGIITEEAGNGKYVISAKKGSFSLDGRNDEAKKSGSRMALRRLIASSLQAKYEVKIDVIDHAGVGIDIKSEKTHFFAELTSDGYINAILEGRYFVFDARIPEGETPRRIENVTLVIEIEEPNIRISVIHKGKIGKVCILRLDALCTLNRCEVCLSAALECPALCQISEVSIE